ncbi:uncharacterized protein JCM6883_001530 [Sporobolomyces salmoneus]|uniref:uncharacterized protein n=1 Tax=Sporobolomyces salmoneus TaxID=183962 RepID=UPI003173D031
MIQTPQAPAYSSRAYAYHSARLYASCGASTLLSPPAPSQMAVASSSPSSASSSRFPDLSLLRSNLPPVVPTSPSAFPILSIGTPARETPPGTPSFFPSFLSSSQRQPPYLSSSPSTYSLQPTSDNSPRTARPPLRPTPQHYSSSGFSSYHHSYHHSSCSSSSSSYSNGSTSTVLTALPTPSVSVDKLLLQPCELGGLEFEDEEEEKMFRLSVQMREGEFDGDMEECVDEWYPNGEMDEVEGMEMD